MLTKQIKKLKILLDLDTRDWVFEIIIGCFWVELLYGENLDD